jgi:membrane-bound inhibitor of C-type lysozyme
MPATNTQFKGQQAPCGRIVDGETYEDQDQETVLTRELDYSCGCRSIRHEYHDGAVSRKIVRHDGTVLVDELLSAE